MTSAETTRRVGLLGALLLSLVPFGPGCARPMSHHLIDAAMDSAHQPERPVPATARARYELLGGDMHCHVSPPDSPLHVSRGVTETVALARDAKLDFVVLTPHVPSLFFQSEGQRAGVLAELADLRASLPKPAPGDPIFIVGFEYTDHGYGHVGIAFADLEEVLSAVPAREALTYPARFFEEWTRRGGILVVNHPLLVPIDSIIPMARANLSWRPFTERGPYPEEIIGADRVAQAFEAYNLAVSELRDRFLMGDVRATLEATLSRLDQEIAKRGRRMTPVGGTDSHSGHLFATTFVLSEERSASAIRDAIAAGRVCVRDPAACAFEVRPPGGPWLPPGSEVKDVDMIEARAPGDDVEIWVNGAPRKPQAPGESIFVPVERGRCAIIRARVGEGYAGPVYVNCPF